jgi:hypothetical protein
MTVAVVVGASRRSLGLAGKAGLGRGMLLRAALAREGHMPVNIGRRELIAALGGSALAWPLAACVAASFGTGHTPYVSANNASETAAESAS